MGISWGKGGCKILGGCKDTPQPEPTPTPISTPTPAPAPAQEVAYAEVEAARKAVEKDASLAATLEEGCEVLVTHAAAEQSTVEIG